MRKKKTFKEGQEQVLEGTDALLYLRNGYWQMRIYLTEEGKYLRRSLGTQSIAIAEERAYEKWREVTKDRAAGKKQFGMTVDDYEEDRTIRLGCIISSSNSNDNYHRKCGSN